MVQDGDLTSGRIQGKSDDLWLKGREWKRPFYHAIVVYVQRLSVGTPVSVGQKDIGAGRLVDPFKEEA